MSRLHEIGSVIIVVEISSIIDFVQPAAEKVGLIPSSSRAYNDLILPLPQKAQFGPQREMEACCHSIQRLSCWSNGSIPSYLVWKQQPPLFGPAPTLVLLEREKDQPMETCSTFSIHACTPHAHLGPFATLRKGPKFRVRWRGERGISLLMNFRMYRVRAMVERGRLL